ncbi:acireductone synthase [Cuniculiplasma sp. SKW4]|uniref:acireductone synthase n=1 Tax=Cuniculiplasma sp. SKW4 TaxID=3400171 RepID=UPI003FD2FD8E
MTVRVILMDIEGTSVPIQFVHKDMFQYARDHLDDFLRRNLYSDEIKRLLIHILNEFKRAHNSNVNIEYNENNLEDISRIVKTMIDEDSKYGALKELEGLIWKEGFEDGTLMCTLYPEVKESVMRWKSRGLRVFIYSSGSVMSQKLLFGHTSEGNLSQMLDGYFDTKVGSKKEKDSYMKIANQIGENPRNILFLSDSEEEIIAAQSAGMLCYLVRRDGYDNKWNKGIEKIENFQDIKL